jgi:uncharacterized iron-regulated membrane protein
MIRRVFVVIHRWAGLAMAGFLILTGLTGSLLAFLPELDRAINPNLYVETRVQTPLTPGELAARTEALAPQAAVDRVEINDPGRAEAYVGPRSDPASGEPYRLGFDLIFLDPYSGQELGRTSWGEITQGFTNLMSFIYKLHFELALGMWGVWILGITALVWTIDCFTGFYLTLPAARIESAASTGAAGRSWWARWMIAWKVKWRGPAYRVNFDLHRAGGLWLWAILLIFAWSSVYMNLWDTVYTWTTRAVLEYRAPWTELNVRENPVEQPALGWRDAQAVGEKLMAAQASVHGFRVIRPVSLSLDTEHGVYRYSVRSSRDIQDNGGRTDIYFDAGTGALRLVLLPTGQYAGNTVSSWLWALHKANVFGLPYRLFVCLLGLVIAMLSITGIYIWWKKRRARAFSASHRAMPAQAQRSS